MLSRIKNYRALKNFCLSSGADLFGVADISTIKKNFGFSEGVKDGIRNAVSLGVALSSLALRDIETQPTKLYFHHYKTANMFLDQLAFSVAKWIEKRRCLALAVPASQITDWQRQKGHLAHKEIGIRAGLGWIGRNNLLVSKHFGAQFRIVTVLTDMPLKTDTPVEVGCGSCMMCAKVCPAGAIHEAREDFDLAACSEKLRAFQRQNVVGQFICGVCVKACSKNKPAGF